MEDDGEWNECIWNESYAINISLFLNIGSLWSIISYSLFGLWFFWYLKVLHAVHLSCCLFSVNIRFPSDIEFFGNESSESGSSRMERIDCNIRIYKVYEFGLVFLQFWNVDIESNGRIHSRINVNRVYVLRYWSSDDHMVWYSFFDLVYYLQSIVYGLLLSHDF